MTADAAPATSFRVALVDALSTAECAIAEAEARWSGPELLSAAWGAARWLDAAGATPSVPVAGLLYGSARSFALAIAGALTGRPLAPVNPKMTPTELAQSISLLAPSVVVVEPASAAVAAELPPNVRVLTLPDRFEPAPAGTPTYRPGDPIAILHTSGTTGVPKPVPISDDAMLRKARATARAYELAPGDRLCTVPPFHHMSGLIMGWSALASGASIAPVPWFSIDVWARFAATDPSHVLMVPTMIEMLLRADKLPEGVRVIAYGGSPMSPTLLRAVMDAIPGVRFVQVYGQTEGSPLTKLSHEDHLVGLERPALLAAAGRPVEGLDLRIEPLDDDDALVGVGEVVVRGDHLFGADADHELRTGDFGRLDDGYLFLVGRKGDKIIRGGENVYPLEVERALEAHPAVVEAGVIGVPDARLGETIKAIVVLADPDAPVSTDELTAFVRHRLSGFKVPTEWAFAASLPRNASGKLLRRALAADAR
ncbi:MAG: long-chain fatty acid--CoA ligase [Acidimicrobiales bacterium]|nr:long-chain fatty acid--CoA ligase [Acidimicrobiales bacterium]